MSTWFYAGKNKEQLGPVEESELLRLNDNGELKGTGLVWRAGMENWVPFHVIAGEILARQRSDPERDEGEPLSPVEVAVCAYSEKVLPRDELVPYGDVLIAAEHKDAFVQGLMESGDTDVLDPEDFVYMGFWWRSLGHLIDALIKWAAGMIGYIPYFIVAASMDPNSTDPEEMIPFGISLGFGVLFSIGLSIYYHTWMVGKYGGEVGKIVIGAKIVTADGSPVSYGRAFARWLMKIALGTYLIQFILPYLLVFLLVFLFFTAGMSSEDPSLIAGGVMVIFLVFPVLVGIFSFVFWMCAFDPEKRTLHDRICGTRVIRKNR